jgi:hypothetical protein
MGFYSWECQGCGQSIRNHHACNKDSAWMNEAVLLRPKEYPKVGHYDGYGRLETVAGDVLELGDDPALYHRTCWHLLGKPKFEKPSRYARDQGHFVGEFDPPEPKTRGDCEALKPPPESKAAPA